MSDRRSVTSDMSVDQFLAFMREKTDEFKMTWAEGRAEDPKGWPERMGLADWLEQFEMLMSG